MKRSQKSGRLFCTFVLVFIGIAGCSRQEERKQVTKNPAESTAPAKDIWVSETTGKEYRVKVENDSFHAEWLNVPRELEAHGAFIRTDCKRQGSKWVGTSTSYLPCTLGKGAKPNLDNWCHLETKIEVTSMTGDAISGQGESLVRFDCKKCKILESRMKDFLWRPQW